MNEIIYKVMLIDDLYSSIGGNYFLEWTSFY